MRYALLFLAACLSKPPPPGGGGPTNPDDAFGQLAVGDNHACSINSAGQLLCWGRAEYGAIGDLTDQTPTPTVVSQETGWTDVAVGAYHSCGILNGKARCWGDNGVGQTTGLTIHDDIPLGSFVPKTLFARDGGTCALDANGQFMCWGGVGLQPTNPAKFQVGGDPAAVFTFMAFNDDHGCALRADGVALCWGSNAAKQLNTDATDKTAPEDAQPLSDRTWSRIAVGQQVTCGIDRDDQSLQCFGDRSNPLFPKGGMNDAHAWTDLAVGVDFMCGIADGGLRCWGYTQFGQTATGIAQGQIDVPDDPAMTGVTNVALGDDFGCARTTTNGVSCWGQNRYGNVGNGEIARAFEPVEIFGNGDAQFITVGLNHACFSLETTGETFCWGDNRQHQVVPGGGTPFQTTPVSIGKNLTHVTAGRTHTCGILIDNNHAFCWGSNSDNQLGVDSPTSSHEIPTRVFSWLSAGPLGTCGIAGGKLFCWGNVVGVPNPSPVVAQTTSLDSSVVLTQVMVGDGHVVITDGKQVWGWGNGCAATGKDSADILVSDPQLVPIPGTPTAIDIAVGVNGGADSCALTDDKQLICWGLNEQSELSSTEPAMKCLLPFTRMSDVATIAGPDPVHFGGKVAMAGDHGCVLSTDSDAVCWGDDDEREIGTRKDPVTEDQILNPFNGHAYGEIAVGGTVGCGIHSNTGHVECWGTSQYGELGNATMFVGMPVPVLP